MVMRRLVLGFLMVFAALGAGRAAADDGLTVIERGGWIIEIVRNGERAACSAIREEASGAAFVVSRVSDSPFVLPVLEVSAAADPLKGSGPVALVAGDYRTLAALDTSWDEDGVHVAAFPDFARADALMAALLVAAELALVQNGEALVVMPLDGFAGVYAEVVSACG